MSGEEELKLSERLDEEPEFEEDDLDNHIDDFGLDD